MEFTRRFHGAVLGGLFGVAGLAQADPVVMEWTRTYVFPPYTYGAMVAVDHDGDVLSVGADPGASDLITIKYDAAGNTLWERHYSMDGFSLRATWVAADGAGNVIVTGYPQTFSSNPTETGLLTLKYDSNGTLLWTDFYAATRGSTTRAIIDGTGNIFVTGKAWFGSYDYVTIKYTPGGARAWVDVLDYQGGFHAPTSMDLDVNGNLLVAGGGPAGNGMLTVLYDTNGTRQWVDARPGTGGFGVKWTNDGDFYLTGSLWSQATSEDVRLLKFNASGALLWDRRYDFGHAELGTKLALDPTGNVFVTGYESSGGYTNWITIKTNAQGDLLWSRIQDSHAENDESPGFMMAGPDGEVYITGIGGPSPIPFNTYVQMVTLRYDADGTTAWTQKHWEWASRGVGAALANDGSCYAVGLGNSITTIKYAQPLAADVPGSAVGPEVVLQQNRPNPFRSSTRLSFSFPQATHARLVVCDVGGRLVRSLVDQELTAGQHEITWDGTDENQRAVASGLYFYKLEQAGQVTHRTMILLR